MPGEWIELDFLMQAMSVNDELGSSAERACVVDRCMFSVAFYSFMAMSVFCGLYIKKCLLWSISKPMCDGALFGFGFDGGGGSRCV
jgi:hypothetical protein